MLKIFKNKYFLFKVVKTNTKIERLEKPKKEKLLLLIPENPGNRVVSVCKSKIPTKYREKRYKMFQELNISNISFF